MRQQKLESMLQLGCFQGLVVIYSFKRRGCLWHMPKTEGTPHLSRTRAPVPQSLSCDNLNVCSAYASCILVAIMASRAEPLSIESLLKKQKEEKEAAAKVRHVRLGIVDDVSCSLGLSFSNW